MSMTADVSHKQAGEMARLLEERSAELLQMRKELEGLRYSVSHDLRAPLRHVIGYSHLALEDYGAGMGPECRKFLKNVEESALKMAAMLDDIFKLSRLSTDELRCGPVKLDILVQQVIEELKDEGSGRPVQWKVGALPQVQGEPTLLKQVFTHLLSNALKFTRPRPAAVIEIGTIGDARPITFFVRDNGVGFDMKFAGRLFGIFQRMHTRAEFEGRGAGLAIAQRIIQKHGGRIWVEAAPDRGATFFFTLEANAKD